MKNRIIFGFSFVGLLISAPVNIKTVSNIGGNIIDNRFPEAEIFNIGIIDIINDSDNHVKFVENLSPIGFGLTSADLNDDVMNDMFDIITLVNTTLKT